MRVIFVVCILFSFEIPCSIGKQDNVRNDDLSEIKVDLFSFLIKKLRDTLN